MTGPYRLDQAHEMAHELRSTTLHGGDIVVFGGDRARTWGDGERSGTAAFLEMLEREAPDLARAAPFSSAAVEAGDLVREARRARGLRQDELAARSGLKQSAISRLERGEGRDGPSYRKLRAVADALGVRIVFIGVPDMVIESAEALPAGWTVARFLADLERERPDLATAAPFSSLAVEAGDLVRRARRTRRMSQDELAAQSGLKQSAISRLERGEGRDGPSYRKLWSVARALDCRIAFLGPRRSVLADWATAGDSESARP
jgi:transcriptional regulator with XRE-family HTH domain